MKNGKRAVLSKASLELSSGNRPSGAQALETSCLLVGVEGGNWPQTCETTADSAEGKETPSW